MKPSFLDVRCDVFMNENEIKMKGRTKSERFKKIQVFDQKLMIQCNQL
jgi:hypothetical protein